MDIATEISNLIDEIPAEIALSSGDAKWLVDRLRALRDAARNRASKVERAKTSRQETAEISFDIVDWRIAEGGKFASSDDPGADIEISEENKRPRSVVMSRVGETGFDIVIDKDDPINEIRMFSEIDDGLLKVYVAPGAGENTAVLLVTPDATGIENPIGAPTIFASFGNRVEYASEDRRKFSEAAKQATERRVSAIRDGNESGRRMK